MSWCYSGKWLCNLKVNEPNVYRFRCFNACVRFGWLKSSNAYARTHKPVAFNLKIATALQRQPHVSKCTSMRSWWNKPNGLNNKNIANFYLKWVIQIVPKVAFKCRLQHGHLKCKLKIFTLLRSGSILPFVAKNRCTLNAITFVATGFHIKHRSLCFGSALALLCSRWNRIWTAVERICVCVAKCIMSGISSQVVESACI